MNKKYQVLQTHFLWGIDVICIILSYLMATHIRYSSNNDWGDKTLHYMVCIIMLLICTVHAFLWDSNKDYITRGSLLELMAALLDVKIAAGDRSMNGHGLASLLPTNPTIA